MKKIKQQAKKYESEQSLNGPMKFLKGNVGSVKKETMKKTINVPKGVKIEIEKEESPAYKRKEKAEKMKKMEKMITSAVSKGLSKTKTKK